MTPTIVLPDGDPHMAALLSRPDFAARLDRLGGARLHADLPADDDELIARIGDATVVILGAYLTGPVLRRLPNLRLVSFTGTGAATFVDLPAARDCGIAVANVARYGDAAVAEHALALALALAKNVVGNDRAVRAGEWHVGQGIELAGKTAGIVGYGGIGARLAGLLEAIGMHVVAWTLHRDPARLTSPRQRFVDLPELLATADLVSLHLLLTDETRGLIDEAMLRTLKPGALLVNTARAELIAPGALERVLAEGRIAAALDVFETEPLMASSPLRSLPNLVLSPHQAYNTPESLQRMLGVVVANIEHYLSGTPVNIVSATPQLFAIGNYVPIPLLGNPAVICHRREFRPILATNKRWNVRARRHSQLMPGLKHQSIVQILRDEPQLLVMFLGKSGFQLPDGAFPVIADSDISHRGPRLLKELRSDNVFLFQGMHEKVAVIVEVQTSSPKRDRQLTWPCYVTSAREVHDCKAYLLVIAASRDALTGSDRVIEIGQPGFDLLPFVTGRERMPPPGGPFFGPELTMLHVLTGTLDLSIHEARMFALASVAEAKPDRYHRYVHLIRIFTPRSARQKLEQTVEDFFKDPFIDRFREEGKRLGIERGMQQGMEQGMQQGMEQGMQQGRADSATRVLLTILAARGIAIPEQTRARIAECADPDQLESWATRAATSTTADEVFAS